MATSHMAASELFDHDGFTLNELVDFALCTPEVGAVNFNILRIFLHDLLKKLNLDNTLADVDDHELAQIDSFKNYIQGAGNQSPIPGVLRYQNQNPPGGGHVTHTGFVYNKGPTPKQSTVNNRGQYPSPRPQQQQQQPYPQQPQQLGAPRGPPGPMQNQNRGPPPQNFGQQYQGQPQQQQQQNQPQQQQIRGPPPPQQVNQMTGPPGQDFGTQYQPPQQQGKGPMQQQGPGPQQQQKPQPGQQPPQNSNQQPQQPQQQQQNKGQPPIPGQPQQTQTPFGPPQAGPIGGQPQQTQTPGGQQASPRAGPGQPVQTQTPRGQQNQRQGQPPQQQQQFPTQGQQPQFAGQQGGPQQQQQQQQPGSGRQQQQGQPPQGAYPQQQQQQQMQYAPQNQQQMPGSGQQNPMYPGANQGQRQNYIPQQTQPPQNFGQQFGPTGSQGQQFAGPPQNFNQQYPMPGQQGQGVQFAPGNPPPQQTNAGQQTYAPVGPPPAPGQGGYQQMESQRPARVRNQGSRPVSQGTDLGPSETAVTNEGSRPNSPRVGPARSTKKLEEKVARLERHLEALYALPANKDLLEMEDTHGMSVNDMWQVIQLNNRIAAAEAAIQKMASLIEDLAKQLKNVKRDSDISLKANAQLADQIDPVTGKVMDAESAINGLRDDLEDYKNQLKNDIQKLAKATGIDLGRVPSFMNKFGGKNVPMLGPDGKPLLDANGKPILSSIMGPDGRPILGADGKPISGNPNLLYGPNGEPLLGPDGLPLLGRQSELMLGLDGRPILGPDGKPLMAPPVSNLLGPDGKPILGPDGRPMTNKMGQLLRTKDGAVQVTPDGKPIISAKGNLLVDKATGMLKVGPDGKLLFSNVGQISLDTSGKPMYAPNGQALYVNPGQPLKGPGGAQLTGPEGKPVLLHAPARPPTILNAPNGKPYTDSAGRPMMSNQVVLGPDGKPFIGPDNRPVRISTSQGLIQLGSDGKPKFNENGQPVYSNKGTQLFSHAGKPMEGPNGQPLHSNIGQILSDSEGRPLRASDGNVLVGPTGLPIYHSVGQILVDDNGKAMLGPDNQFIYSNLGQILIGPDGKPVFGSDGTPIYTNEGQSLVAPDGKPLFPQQGMSTQTRPGAGNQVQLGPDGKPIYSGNGKNILGPDGKPLLGPNGKPLSNHMGQMLMGLNGLPILGQDGQPLYSNVGQLLLDAAGAPMYGPDGKNLFSNFGQISLGPGGKALPGPDGKTMYTRQGETMLGPDNKPLLGADGAPIILQSVAQKPGKPILDENGQQLLGDDGKPLLSNQVLIGPDGRIVYSPDKKPITLTGPGTGGGPKGQIVLGPDGKPVFDSNGKPIFSVEGSPIFGLDGQPLRGADGNTIRNNIGQIIMGSNGKPLLGPNGQPVYANLGQIILTSDSKPVLGPDGKMLYSNIAQIMLGPDRKPMFNPDGSPMYSYQLGPIVGSDGKPFYPSQPDTYSQGVQNAPGMLSHGQQYGPDHENSGQQYRGPGSSTTGQQFDVSTAQAEVQESGIPGMNQTSQTDEMNKQFQDGSTGPVPVAYTDGPIYGLGEEDGTGMQMQGQGIYGADGLTMTSSQQRVSIEVEMQDKYSELQGMQRQLANDIQDKMEFIYQKLIREIANQQMTTSPYMAIGQGLGKCMGPGICTGHGMPAGTAVCQFPAHDESARLTSAYRGATAPSCPHCHGTGQNPLGTCPNCSGSGRSAVRGPSADMPCQHCAGSGLVSHKACPHCMGKGTCPFHSHGGGGGPCPHGLEEYKVCPGPGICPGAGVCPSCKDDTLHQLRAPNLNTLNQTAEGRGVVKIGPGMAPPESSQPPMMGKDQGIIGDSDTQVMDILKKECKTLILLPKDLEELRERVKRDGKIPNVFDEMDILERIHTLWDAVNSLKHNDEALAVRMIKQDALLKKFPRGQLMDKIQKIPPENLDAIASATLDRPMIIPSGTNLRASGGSNGHLASGEDEGEDEYCDLYPPGKDIGKHSQGGLRTSKSGKKTGSRVADDDIQTIFNNLSNLLVESSAQKDRLESVSETLKNMESSMVTKHMLIDAMSDKADKGQMNTKVSYDEFGNSMDELTTRMQNLLIEVYQKNENWKNITDHLGEEITAKLDKIELAPVRAYFKSHLKTLEERVAHLTQQFEEPDPAGTRKKLLRDYNCLSCDRHAHISGVTNTSQLPHFGPILAGHTTASQRAYDLHRMRQQKVCKYDAEGRDMNLVSKELCQGGRPDGGGSQSQTMNQSDMMQMVNRYVGGSHTAVSTGDRIAALNKKFSKGGEVLESQPPPQNTSQRSSRVSQPNDYGRQSQGQMPPIMSPQQQQLVNEFYDQE